MEELNEKLKDIENETWQIFHKRISALLSQNVDKNHPSVQREVNRVLSLNGGELPEAISSLLK